MHARNPAWSVFTSLPCLSVGDRLCLYVVPVGLHDPDALTQPPPPRHHPHLLFPRLVFHHLLKADPRSDSVLLPVDRLHYKAEVVKLCLLQVSGNHLVLICNPRSHVYMLKYSNQEWSRQKALNVYKKKPLKKKCLLLAAKANCK